MIDRAALFTWARIGVWLLLGVALSCLFAGQARAGGGVFQTQEAAYNACKVDEAAQIAAGSYFPGPYPQVACALFVSTGYAPYAGQYRSQSLPTNAAFNFWFYATTCLDGSAYPAVGVCGGAVACLAAKARTNDPTDALYIAPTDRRTLIGATSGAAQCRGGCTWAAGANDSDTVGIVSTGSGADLVTAAQFGFTGEACSVTAESPAPATDQLPVKPTEQVCQSATGSQLTLCVRQDGQHCYTASSGKQICWRPGETGTKTTGNLMQKREPGTVASPVAPTPPAGETLTQSGTPTPKTTTTVVNNVTTTTNTTTTNYTTTGGTDAGSTDSGVPATGTGGTAPAGDGEGSGSVSAGTCEANYTCTGVSAVDCAILQETTKNRCATEANNPGKVMSAGEEAAATADGAGFTGTADSTGVTSETEYGADGLDDSGFLPGGRSCPTIPPMDILGQQFVMDTSAVCDWMTVGGYLVLLFGSIASLMILKGS